MRVCGAPTTGFATTKGFSRVAQVFTLPVATWMQIASAIGMKIEPLRRPVRLTRFADGIAYYEPASKHPPTTSTETSSVRDQRPWKRRTLDAKPATVADCHDMNKTSPASPRSSNRPQAGP